MSVKKPEHATAQILTHYGHGHEWKAAGNRPVTHNGTLSMAPSASTQRMLSWLTSRNGKRREQPHPGLMETQIGQDRLLYARPVIVVSVNGSVGFLPILTVLGPECKGIMLYPSLETVLDPEGGDVENIEALRKPGYIGVIYGLDGSVSSARGACSQGDAKFWKVWERARKASLNTGTDGKESGASENGRVLTSHNESNLRERRVWREEGR
ncbi:hypothetical protein BJY52DRAFT_1223546 [Lactarius psammicola]|nr:hypothetical protein BJY52DRAFT_1223546 [Lactarius psammicola]